ncbi:hypothetical protein ABPG72_007627 [Tetrahymena utriculariae]
MASNMTYTNFYVSLSKNSNDKFKLFIADQFQINSSYISQNDFVQEIDFTAGETEIYVEIYSCNREYPKQKILENIQNDPIGKSAVIKQMKTYRVMLQFDPQQAQNYQLLLLNQCELNDVSCTNQVQIQYSLSDFLLSASKSVKSNLTYMIVFLSITFIGIACFCCYSIYKNYLKKRMVRLQEINKQSCNPNTESQFKQIRQKAEEQIIQDEEMHQMRDQTVIIEAEAKSISNLQINNAHSHNASINKIIDVKNQINVNKFNIIQASRAFQSNLIKFQKQESDGKSNHEIAAARSQNRFNSSQEKKIKMKQPYNTNSNLCEQDKRIERINQILEQNQLKICSVQNPNSNIQQPNSPNKIKKELKLDQATTQNTCNNLGGNISNNFHETNSSNSTIRQNSKQQCLNNIVYLNKQTVDKDGEYNSTCLNEQKTSKASIPSEDSHALPQINKNNKARPVYHYEIQQVDQKKDKLKTFQRPIENCLGYNTLNYITTNSSNTINQIFSNLDFENQSPIENLIQGQKVPLISTPELTKYLPNQNSKNLSQAVFLMNNPCKTNPSSHAQLNVNESSSEEEDSSQLQNDKNKLPNIKEENYQIIQEKEEQQQVDDNKNLNSQQEQYNLSQNVEIVGEGFPSELKAIDGSKIQNHRRKILNMGIRKEISNQDTVIADAKENELLLICQQQISNIMLKNKNEMDSINSSVNNGVEDLEKGIRLDQLNNEEKDDNQSSSNGQIQKLEFFKIETPEIFFQNCPKCQSKQHEFQLKLSNFGEQGVKPKDKYCSLCLMKAEMSEVKMADSF